VPMVKDVLNHFDNFKGCSYDKGFWSPGNKKELDELLEHVVLPKKGKLSVKQKKEEYSDKFVASRKKHSAVESGINALENHGLDRCLDRGVIGFERYISLAVLARNIQKIGAILQAKELKKLKRRKRNCLKKAG
ncbi:MAG: ISNCY family transposase, partial [Verrucomicrobiota bacterium]|nr:ISNCY family transposase [Verrucomicrobiota bacterium]